MPLCQQRHRLTTMHEVLSIKKWDSSDEYDDKLPDKNPKKINCKKEHIFSRPQKLLQIWRGCKINACVFFGLIWNNRSDRCEKKSFPKWAAFIIICHYSAYDKTWSIASLTLSSENGFSRKTSAPFSIAISRAVPNPEIMIIFISGYFFLT